MRSQTTRYKYTVGIKVIHVIHDRVYDLGKPEEKWKKPWMNVNAPWWHDHFHFLTEQV